MIKRFERYLIGEVLRGVLLALLVIVSLDALLAFIAELGDVGRGHYNTGQALLFVVLTLPHRTLDLLPVATLLGALMSLGALAAGSELIVMRSAGISRLAIITALLKLGVVLLLCSYLLGEYLVPYSEQLARNGRAIAKSSGQLHKSDHGVWVNDGRAFVHIDEFRGSGELARITRYEFSPANRLSSASRAGVARYDGEEWQTEGVERSLFGEQIVVAEQVEQEAWPSLLDPELLSVVAVGPRYLSAWDLAKYILYLRANGLSAERYELALWNKLVSPFSILVMLIFVVPFVLGPLRDASSGRRLVVGLLVGLGFYLLNRTYYQFGQLYSLSPIFSALFPSLLMLSIALYAMRRIR